jgi:amidase
MTSEFLSLGAVLYVKTSVPQTLLLGESVNNLIGKTLNPHNSLLSCGGSSGGEGALIGMKGSSLGVGTDIGGSVRIPAAFSGIYSLKPTHDRMSYRDMANTSPGQTTYASSCGFMASSLDGIALGMEAILSTKPWLRDPEVVAIPWRKEVVQGVAKPLKLGIFWSDDAVTPHPPITRGLKMVVEAAKRAGHQIVEWTPPAHGPAAVLHVSFTCFTSLFRGPLRFLYRDRVTSLFHSPVSPAFVTSLFRISLSNLVAHLLPHFPHPHHSPLIIHPLTPP